MEHCPELFPAPRVLEYPVQDVNSTFAGEEGGSDVSFVKYDDLTMHTPA